MYIYPDFLQEFSCQMCGTCCRNDWQVTVDQASYARNRELFTKAGRENEFVQAFQVITKPDAPGEYAFITKKNNACWFLEGDNRCYLHRQAGHEHLDSVCQTYPRYPLRTARGWEVTLSFSCPAVLKLVSRQEPIDFIRAQDKPIAFDKQAAAAQVFPRQQPDVQPLYYYFELEQHCMDILQFRGIPMQNRLDFLAQTVRAINELQGSLSLGQNLRRLLYRNYDLLDDQAAACQEAETSQGVDLTAAILMEHFFVNLVFKKVGYLYGLERMTQLFCRLWQQVEELASKAKDSADDLKQVKAAIMRWELEYSHNRKALMK